MKKFLLLAAVGLLTFSAANAGSITVANSDIEMSGGVTAAYFYTTNIGKNANNDYFSVTNFDIDLTAKVNSAITFEAGIGEAILPDLLDPKPSAEGFEVEYAYVNIAPVDNLTISAGKLLTNVGYELYDTFNNPNYHYGLVWWGQPVTYPGARLTYTVMEGMDVYAEYTQDGTDSFAVGSLGSFNGIDYAISYFDYAASKNLVDLVLSTEIAGIQVALNADYQWLDDSAKEGGKDDSAWGAALYVIPNITDTVSVPVRIEYISEGNSEIYGVAGDNAWSFTITPTWKPTKNTYLRAEIAYVNTDEKGFTDDDGSNKDNRVSAGIEAGFLF